MDDTPLYLGIDPGVSGGLAVVWCDGSIPVPMPTTDRDVCDWIRTYCLCSGPCFAVLEKVSAGFPGTGKVQMAKVHGSYRALRMALAALSVPFEEVPASKWQRGLGIPPRKRTETRTAWKNRLKARAQSLFPGEDVTLATADALLIAEYCRRSRLGLLNYNKVGGKQ